jgi:tryptophan synthase beta chain
MRSRNAASAQVFPAPAGRGRFGDFGGQYVAPILIPVLDRLEDGFEGAWSDPAFRKTFEDLLQRFVGRPTPLFEVSRVAGPSAGRIVLKRDDLSFEGGNYATSALGQCLLAQRMGLRAVTADTGSGENGVAVAAIAAQLGLACRIFMGGRDAARNAAAVRRMIAFGAEVSVAEDREATLHAAMSAAFRHWMSVADTTAYVAGGPIGPHPFPSMVGAFEAVVGRETRLQLLNAGLLPYAVVSAVGGGASTIGLFKAFVDDARIKLVAVEAGGSGAGPHAARLAQGRRGVLHGAETLVLTDDNGNIEQTASIAPGLTYPGAAPELADLVTRGRVTLARIGDEAARAAVLRLAAREGILVSLEAGHALAAGMAIAGQVAAAEVIVVMVPSSGEKDLEAIGIEAPQ